MNKNVIEISGNDSDDKDNYGNDKTPAERLSIRVHEKGNVRIWGDTERIQRVFELVDLDGEK